MSFPENVANEALVRSERCCCICHKFCGVKIELHHIVQKADGGEDTLENCIPLCFDCHSDMGKADPKHPKGKHYSEKELRMHRDNWYKKVESGFIASNTNAVYDEDIALFQKICALFTPNIRYWLSETDISKCHPHETFSELEVYLFQADDPHAEFIHPELEKKRGELVCAIDYFLSCHATNVYLETIGGKNVYATKLWLINHTTWYPRALSEDVIEEVCNKEANILRASASELWNTYCDFVKQCRPMLSKKSSL